MKWAGINRRLSPVAEVPGVSEYQQNTRMRVAGELQRRWGFQSTSIAKQAGAILNIASAYPAGGNYLTFDVAQSVGANGGTLGGIGPIPPPPVQPPRRRRPGVTVAPGFCITWGPVTNSGTTTTTDGFSIVPNSCAGTLVVVATESERRSSSYGYQFTVTANAVPILTTGCLVNAGTSAVIPAGTTTIAYTVTGGCAGGSTEGDWSMTFTCP